MTNPQVLKMTQRIIETLPNYGSPAKAAEGIRQLFLQMGDLPPGLDEILSQAVSKAEESLQPIEVLRRCSLAVRRTPWYHGPKATDRHWNALKGFIANELRWGDETLQSMDASSTEVVSLMANPATAEFRCRGLVVGYVQSGKTANMTAVIAKALDAGYNFVVLLGGATNKLRAQTQRRLARDIVARYRMLWQLYTTEDENGDFVRPANRHFTMPVEGRAQLAVIKKEAGRLSSFLQTIKDTPPVTLKALKVLLIDDECDQASVNASSDDDSMTRTNELIRRILNAFPAVTYVGYTATPFANVFIDPFPRGDRQLDDLYPADFITSLPRPANYFGTREVFGYPPDDAEATEGASEGRDMLRAIPLDEIPKLVPGSYKPAAEFQPEITHSVESALLWFIAACALRRRRGENSSHMTMLVHTSALTAQHRSMADSISRWLETNREALKQGAGPAWDRLNEVWSEETRKVPLDPQDERRLRPADLVNELEQVLDRLEVVIENSVSDQRLDYTGDPKITIVVGGSVLARGLTLEGLTVSVFLRTSRQYDTLLQMGRWFGYREGYADLPRLWTTSDLIANFRALATIEEEIRSDIEVYRERNATPMEFAIRVRSIPGMAITSAAKMRHAFRTSISFEGRHLQTIRFDHKHRETVDANWRAASTLLDDAGRTALQEGKEGRWLWRGVPFSVVRKFIRDYRVSDAHLDLRGDLLLGYLDRASSRLSHWNVAVIAPARGKRSERPLGALGQVPLNVRSQLQVAAGGHADIKALMSKQDIVIDASDRPQDLAKASWDELKLYRPECPLLLIYPIERDSRPRTEGGTRIALEAVGDLIGIGIVFPGGKDRSGDYFAVELDVPTPEQLDGDAEPDFDYEGEERRVDA